MGSLCRLSSAALDHKMDTKIQHLSYQHFWRRCDSTLGLLGLSQFGFSLALLCAGGSTHHFFTWKDVPRLRRCGRWKTEATLEHYIQEATYAIQLKRTTRSHSALLD
eukprot:TRINITY_DN93162_c0_g1_i1.p1 TRINITY_DN93162_c0_g1~~TRINITY_DN93162_c0_g1_i1.p1  ORF type:complete len:107 (+),score=7.17 TRINITY_DN93162_c0_g1_i1:301-621(+)